MKDNSQFLWGVAVGACLALLILVFPCLESNRAPSRLDYYVNGLYTVHVSEKDIMANGGYLRVLIHVDPDAKPVRFFHRDFYGPLRGVISCAVPERITVDVVGELAR